MYRQSPRNRGQRPSKSFKVKHGLQLILMLGVGVWLFYQTQRSYSHKNKSLGEGANVSERLRLGRKDIPDFQDANNVPFGENEEVIKINSGSGENIGKVRGKRSKENDIKTKGDDEKEVKKVGNVGMMMMKKETLKTRVGELSDDIDSSDDNKQANTNAFSDATFTNHSQYDLGKGEAGVGSDQSDLNANPTLKIGDSNSDEGGDSTTFLDTNGNVEENGVENPGSSSSETYEKTRFEQPNMPSHNSASEEHRKDNKKEQLEVNNTRVKNVNKEQQEEQVESSKKVSEGQKEDEEADSSASEEVKDRTDLDTLPDTGKQTHSKDAVAL